MLELKVIGSSSSGNCYLIRTPESKEVLIIECGVRYKQIEQALDFDLKNVVGCLVSHEHKDHSKAIQDVVSHAIDVYASAGTLTACKTEGHRAHPVKSLEQFKIGRFTILPFDTKHDCAEPLGYLIHHPEIGKILFATDTYYIKYKFKGLTHIMIECNFSKEILEHNIAAGKIHPSLKKRLLSSHMSLDNLKKFLQANDLKLVEAIYLMHLSDGNSSENQFREEIQKLTGIPVTIC